MTDSDRIFYHSRMLVDGDMGTVITVQSGVRHALIWGH